MTGALDGVKVIDFGQYIAGPLTGMLLADQGADVIRVDPPSGPLWDTPANATWNRGKRSIALDLKRPGDVEIARRLVAAADVVVENFRPGVMDAFGLGAEAMSEANPRLVYCSIPGFASDDPRAATAAWEGVVGAAAGTYRRVRVGGDGGRPVYTALPLASSYAAIQASVAVAMALGVRERDGVGQRIEMPLFDAMFAAVGYNGQRIHSADAAAPAGAGVSGQYQCQDGRWVMFMTGNLRARQSLEAMGLSPAEAAEFTDRERMAGDPELAAKARSRTAEVMKTRPAQEWEDLVAEAGGECAVCRSSEEWTNHPHALASQTIIEVVDPRLGVVRQPGIAARMSLTPGAVRGPAPMLDADREELLAELPVNASDGNEAGPRTAADAGDETIRTALGGMKVLDLCIVLAGPTCGRTLAEYGADVIKIEAPDRPPGAAFHNDINRGKRSIVLDLKRPEGLEAFWALLEDADIVVQNFRKGVADRLGIGYDQVRARKPDIIYASLNTYGHLGPFAGRPGHEQIAQAATGMQARYGGDEQPQLQRYAVNDYATGFLGAYAVALAVLHHRRTGRGQQVDAALAYTATTLQSVFMQNFAGKTWDEPRGQDSLGGGPLHRAYEASDGWFFLAARESQLPAIAAIDGLDGIDALSGAELARALEQRLRAGSIEDWVRRLTRAGAGAHRVVNNTRELMDDPWAQEHGLSLTREHDGLGLVTTIGPGARLSRTPLVPGRPAPQLGSNGREILVEAGIGDRFDALVASEIVHTPDGATAIV